METILGERAGLCALNRIFGFEPKKGRRLLEAFGSAANVFRQPHKDIAEVLGAYAGVDYASRICESAFDSAAMELERLAENGCRFIGFSEPGYPKLLLECNDPPLGLYCRSVSPPEAVFGVSPGIAVVGTRNMTGYGKDWSGRLVSVMARSRIKPLIISGLAIGIDITAHRAALEGDLPTVAVMATGIDRIYPEINRKTGERIATTEGCALVTDYPPQTPANRINFLRRNRIIAGIARATVLVESRIRGGGMMTARLAASYDRDVFALPGRIDDPVSQGCNLLIRENLAEPVGDLGEWTDRLGLGRPEIRCREDFLGEVEKFYAGRADKAGIDDIIRLAMTVSKHRGISQDELGERLGWTFSRVSRLAAILQCDGFISIDLLQHCTALQCPEQRR